MILNYLKWIFRSLAFNKIYTFINVFGLTIGLSGAFFILIYIFNETYYDKHQKDIDQIYRVLLSDQIRNTTAPYLTYNLNEKIENEIPEIEYMSPIAMASTMEIKKGNETFEENNVLGVTKDFLNIFTLDFIYGSKDNCFNSKSDVIITESVAKKYFGNENPINKQLSVIILEQKHNLTVKAVVKDYPKLSTVSFDFLINASIVHDWIRSIMPEFNSLDGFFYQYIKIRKGSDRKIIAQKLESLSKGYHSETMKPILKIQPMSEFYLGSKGISNNFLPAGNKNSVILFASVAVIVLILALFNYIILSFAQYMARVKEFGIRRVAGASKQNIRIQVIGETLIVVLSSAILAILIVNITKENVQNLLNINLQYSIKSNLTYYVGFLGVILFITFIAGQILSAKYFKTNTIESIKNQFITGQKKSTLRNVLLTVQLIVFTSLLMVTIVVKKQIGYIIDYSPGFNKNNLITLRLEDDLKSKHLLLRNELEKHPAVLGVSGCSNLPPLKSTPSGSPYNNPDNPEIKALLEHMWVDFNFLKTLKIELVEGRDFDANLRTDSTNSILINESAVKALNIENPIGKYLGKKEIIGVVKDFNAFSLHSNIPPLLLRICPQKMIYEVAIRYDPNNVKAVLGFLDSKLLELSPETKQEYYFYDEWAGKIYDEEEQLGNILVFFTSGSILIAVLGLLGLSIFFIEKRTKEIGIRKVHGAGTLKILRLISRDFSKLLIPTWLISFPLAWYLLDKWLQRFAYQTNIDWWIYVLCGIAGFIVIQTAISFKTLRATKISPIETLRYE